jgi:hypothetical protein
MPKFRIKMKLQGFELEIEGSREEASRISQNLGEQMSALLRPAGVIIDGGLTPPALPPVGSNNMILRNMEIPNRNGIPQKRFNGCYMS